MTEERLDMWLGELRSELSVAPSPQMIAVIRGRVARPARSVMWQFMWLAAGIAAIAVLTVLPQTRGARPSAVTPPVTAGSLPVAHTVEPLKPSATTLTPVRAARPRLPGATARVAVAEPVTDLPTVIAPPDQGIALRRLLTSLRAGRGTVPAPGAVATGPIETLPELEALVIPLLTLEPLTGTSAPGGGRRTP